MNSSNAPLDLSRPMPVSDFAAMASTLDYALSAGFPSPAEDHLVKRLDLIELMSSHPQATYFMRISGHSMKDAGIFDNDIVAVNRALEPQHNDIVVAVVDNEFTCKRLYRRAGRVRLVADNPAYPDIRPKDGQTIEVWGVVTASLKLFRR